jgi:flagellar hook-length control protein FliK
MADLPLLVNSTDTALLSSNAVPSVSPNGLAADTAKTEGFASVLGKQLMPGEGATAMESPPPADETRSLAVTETGESTPLDGKALPAIATEGQLQTDNEFPELDAALASMMALNVPAEDENSGNSQIATTAPTAPEPTLLTQDALLQAALQQVTATQAPQAKSESATQLANGMVASPSFLNVTANSQNPRIAEQNTQAVLPNAAQDAQRAATLPAIPAMLGKSISTTAEQVLERVSLNAGKAQYLRSDMAPAVGTTATNTHGNQIPPGVSMGMQSLIGSTQRVDMFNSIMGGLSQANTQGELHLPVNAAPVNLSNALASTAALPDATVNLSAEIQRPSGVAGNGVSPLLTVSTPVGQPAWAGEVGQRVTWLANSDLREAQLQLHPRSLGAVDVRISFGHEQQMHVNFSAANPIARDALEASLPRLREMFEQQGLNLGDANISHEPPREQQHDNNLTKGASISAEGYASTEESMDTDGLQPPTRHWLGEGMLNAYA